MYKSNVPIEPQRLPERDCRLLAEYSQKQAKSHKIAEWKSFPLATEVQRRTWWLEKTERIARAEDASSDRLAQKSPVATSPWVANSPITIHEEATLTSVATQSAYVSIQQPSQPQASWRPVTHGSGQPELDTNLRHLDHQTADISIVGNMTVGECSDMPEAPTHPPQSQSILQSDPSADARWRKYF
ncbi:uncharacterized protein yc1106_09154 [Curvularia clavata]|uniref:Uncharacterized protein n=1 Tax=Curvularia clavata TaxID=95742 RepID=A0A9Q9DXF2_CURCL|nr:uncharacterized protein yc1106_09154 [Curvularia clavata]